MRTWRICNSLVHPHIEFVPWPDQPRPARQHANFAPEGGYRIVRRCRCRRLYAHSNRVYPELRQAEGAMRRLGYAVAVVPP